MSCSPANLLRPTIWLSRADLDRLHAAERGDSADTEHGNTPAVAAPGGASRTSELDDRRATPVAR